MKKRLTADHPFTEKETKAVSYENEQQSTKADQIKETDEQLVDTTVQEVSLFADEAGRVNPRNSKESDKSCRRTITKRTTTNSRNYSNKCC